ncbi:MAG: SAM-dependent methyltransferase [Candidatus Accumulibacter sp.]|jgi:16S rRNA (cytidine1402-2'-O)-methyltransferase|nr:SAM-dependent methyltransferase [Accumulibacter sp.]
MKKGRLFLIPVPLGDLPPERALSAEVVDRVRELDYFVAENAKSARAVLKRISSGKCLQEIRISELNAHTPESEVAKLLSPLFAGNDVGVLSEAGCPGVADPGAELVALAHRSSLRVVPLVGPSSIVLALMASGFSGQNFAFHGYLPVKDDARRKKILELERESRRENRTQIFIEAPYRNRRLFDALLVVCAPQTRIGVATELTLPDEHISVHSRAEWQEREAPRVDRRPTVFLLYSFSKSSVTSPTSPRRASRLPVARLADD